MRNLSLLPVAAFAILVAGSPLRADQITSGTVDIDIPSGLTSNVQFELFGPNISFTGSGATTAGPCRSPFCVPGQVLNGGLAGVSGEDRGLSGVFTRNGVMTPYIALPGLRTGAGIEFMFTLPIPEFPGQPLPEALTLEAPFTAQARLDTETISSGLLTGGGIVTLQLALFTPTQYRFRSAHYDFQAIPEPSTWLLIAGAFAASFVWRRSHHRH